MERSGGNGVGVMVGTLVLSKVEVAVSVGTTVGAAVGEMGGMRATAVGDAGGVSLIKVQAEKENKNRLTTSNRTMRFSF
jgi:hypothetical protein